MNALSGCLWMLDVYTQHPETHPDPVTDGVNWGILWMSGCLRLFYP